MAGRRFFEILISVSFIILKELRVLDSMVVLFLIFEGTSALFSIVAASIYIPTTSHKCFLFSTLSPSLLSFFFFSIIAILTGARWYPTGFFICISPMASDVEYHFLYPLAVCMSLFGEMSIQFLCLFSKLVVFLLLSYRSCLYILDIYYIRYMVWMRTILKLKTTLDKYKHTHIYTHTYRYIVCNVYIIYISTEWLIFWGL